MYRGRPSNTWMNGHNMIACGKIGEKYRVKFVHSRLSFGENRIWKFIKYM